MGLSRLSPTLRSIKLTVFDSSVLDNVPSDGGVRAGLLPFLALSNLTALTAIDLDTDLEVCLSFSSLLCTRFVLIRLARCDTN